MKRYLLAVLIVNTLGCTNEKHHAQYIEPDKRSLEMERRVMSLSNFQYYKRLSEHPTSVSDVLKIIIKGDVAEFDEPFNDTDAISPGLPFLQHVVSATANDFYFFILRSGGYVPTARLYVYKTGESEYCSYLVGWYEKNLNKVISDLSFGEKKPRKEPGVCKWHETQAAYQFLHPDSSLLAQLQAMKLVVRPI